MSLKDATPAAEQIRNTRIERLVPLASPQSLLEELPLGPRTTEVLLRGRTDAQAVLDGSDDRLLVVVGPCSIHDTDASREYAGRLAAEVGRLRDDLCIAMRVYFEKPRTTIGWKGLINDPHLDGSGDVNAGLRMARAAAARRARARAPGRLRVPRSDHAAVHLRHGLLGCDRRAHGREPGPSPARLGPVDAGRLQEPHRRQRPGRGRRGAGGGGPARVRRDRRPRWIGDPPYHRQRRLARDPARRPRRAQLRRRLGRRGRRAAARGRASGAGDDRSLPRQQRQGPRSPARGRRRRSAPRSPAATGRSSA